MELKDTNYIVIQAPMVTELKLSGNALIIFALIHGMSQSENHTFHGSIEYISKWTNLSHTSVISNLKMLCEKGYVNKYEERINGIKFCSYDTNYANLIGSKDTLGVVKKLNQGSKETLLGGSKETLPNNIYIDNIYDNNIQAEPAVLFPEQTKRTNEGRCLFANSKYSSIDAFVAAFDGKPEFADIDLVYYYHSVADWSASKGKMMKDWIATARNFMRSDREKNKLHMKPKFNDNDSLLNLLKEHERFMQD